MSRRAIEFCTLFDSRYLLKGLALHESLLRHRPDACLTVYCFDAEAERLLQALDLQGVSTVSLGELEDADTALLSVKPSRTRREYCWTATPALPLDMLRRRPEAETVTYLDADLYFFADPEPLFEEMGDASVLITPHRFPNQHRHLDEGGLYNVQFLPFANDDRGRAVLEWWHDRCIEWCFDRVEPDRFGDQKYLDKWPELFRGVHVVKQRGGGVAPWNLPGSRVEHGPADELLVDGEPVVFVHFHALTLRSGGRHDLYPAAYAVPREAESLLYTPYLDALERALALVRSIEPGFSAGVEPRPSWIERARRARLRAAARIRS